MDKKTIALVIVVCAVVFSIGIFAGRFIMLTETPVPTPTPISTPTPKPIPIATPSPAITPVPTPLEEIYKEFYYDILGWENAYYFYSGRCSECIEEGDEERPRQALKDFDTIIEKFINGVKESGYESQVAEEFIDYDDLLEVHATLRWVDNFDIYQSCDFVEDIPEFISDLKVELKKFIS